MTRKVVGTSSAREGVAPVALRRLGGGSISDDDVKLLVDHLMALKVEQIAAFLVEHKIPKSGTKAELRARINTALEEGTLSNADIIQVLDRVGPWGKQHVYLFDGPKGNNQSWQDAAWVKARVEKHQVAILLNAVRPLALPKDLRLSTIEHSEKRLRVVAVQRREYMERSPDDDKEGVDAEGRQIELRAYAKHVARTLVVFEWDLTLNIAILQITQLGKDADYEETATVFTELTASWLPIVSFSKLDVRRAICALHKAEEAKQGETRSHGIAYMDTDGRLLSGKSASSQDALFGNHVIDDALNNLRDIGIAHDGNFYWLSKPKPATYPNPLEDEVHVVIVGGEKQRVRFTTPNSEEVVRYVIRRVRARCA